jgi:hypothetical protein
MFCPGCKAEYRQGFTRCADCEAELVDQLPDETPPTARLESVWTGEDREDCVFMCQRLKAAGISVHSQSEQASILERCG